MHRWVALFATAVAIASAAESIRPHPANPHYFLFRGKPLAIVSSGEHYGAVLNGAFDWRKYLDTLANEGMTYTRIFSGAYREVPGDFGIERNTLAPTAENFVAPWVRRDGKLDLAQFNPEYFARLKEFVAESSKRGIIVEMTLFTSTYADKQWSVHSFNPANNHNNTAIATWKSLHTLDNGAILGFQEQLVRKIVRELNEFDNVIYEIQNEPWSDRTVVAKIVNPYLNPPAREKWPNTADLADDASLAWQQRVAEWVASEEAPLANKHLIAQNVCNFLYPVKSLVKGATTVNFHYAYPEAVLWNYAMNIPIGYDETGFLGTADRLYRAQAWRFMLAGGSLFNHLDYSFSVGKEDGTDSQPKSPGGGSTALRKQFKLLNDILHSTPLLRMKPDMNVVTHSPGAVAQALSSRGEAYIIYLQGSGPVDLALSLPAGNYKAEWINPETGAALGSRDLMHRGGRVVLKSPAFDYDMALKIAK